MALPDASSAIMKSTLLILLIGKRRPREANRFIQIMQPCRVEPEPKSSFPASLCLCSKEQRKVHEKIGNLKYADSPTEDMFLQVAPRGLSKTAKDSSHFSI